MVTPDMMKELLYKEVTLEDSQVGTLSGILYFDKGFYELNNNTLGAEVMGKKYRLSTAIATPTYVPGLYYLYRNYKPQTFMNYGRNYRTIPK